MPRLSDTMEEGTILAWLVADGATVSIGEEIVEIEGDKATTAGTATAEGPLKIIQAEGVTVAVREPIAWIGDDVPAAPEPAAAATAKAAAPEPAAAATAKDPASDAGGRAPGRGGPSVSPVARRLAAERGIDLATVPGSGPGGRIVVSDVEAVSSPQADRAASAARTPDDTATPAETAKGAPTRVELTRTQELIASRMASAKATIPDFQLWVDIDMETALAERESLRSGGAAPSSLNDMIVRAVARALREFPNVNATYRDGSFEHYPRVNVAVAVAAERALYAPTIFDADRKSLAEIATETRMLAALGREGRLTPAQTAGATFTVSNLGMFGISGFRALVTAPQSGILAIGSIEERIVPVDGQPAVRRRLTATLSIDHRIVYGAEAARFLARVRELLESKEERS
jgi:pyruvate dehydrogenase E2 component (dihydrolipoamide acetyltransferase)